MNSTPEKLFQDGTYFITTPDSAGVRTTFPRETLVGHECPSVTKSAPMNTNLIYTSNIEALQFPCNLCKHTASEPLRALYTLQNFDHLPDPDWPRYLSRRKFYSKGSLMV